MALRSALYKLGAISSQEFTVPVISVGNLTMGGTGKTPTVMMLARHFQGLGFRPAIISRGYKGSAGGTVNAVSDGQDILLDASAAGDEPYMMASALKTIPVLTGKKRADPCRYAIDTLQCNLLLLDDGFQHQAVKRDLDIVLFNATTLAGNSRVFPGGELREPVSALNRADAFILTGVTSENSKRAHSFKALLEERFGHAPTYLMGYSTSVSNAFSTEKLPPQKDLPLYAFCGIAHPERFTATVISEGYQMIDHTCFTDHADYTPEDLNKILYQAEKCGAKGLITTHKDMVKIKQWQSILPLYYVKIEAQPPEELLDFIEARIPITN